MKRRGGLGAALLCLLCVFVPVGASGRQSIMRSVTVLRGTTLTLGKAVPRVLRQDLVCPLPTSCALRPGTFGGTKTLGLELTTDGRVRAMIFTYGPDGSFDARVEHFAARFGTEPTRTASGHRRAARWEDPLTEFELEATDDGVAARLIDESR